MATATWFDYTVYMANKLDQVNAIAGGKQYSPEEFKVEFEKAGYVGEEGAFKHFQEYGDKENVAPNALFNADEYYTAKAAREFKTDKPTASQIADVKKAFADGGMTAWDHYVAFGSNEGVEPSFSFNTEAYLTAKVAALNTGNYDGKSDWTPEDVAAAIEAAGMTVLEHFMGNGGDGKFEVAVSYDAITKGGAQNPFVDPTPPIPTPDPGPAPTHNLTTAVDYIAPDAEDPAFRTTDGDDIIAGKITLNPSTNTVQEFDTVDGGKGNNTFELTMETNVNGALGKMDVSNIQTLKVTATKGALNDDVKDWSGLTSVVVDGVTKSTLVLNNKITQASYQNISGAIAQSSDTALTNLTLTKVSGNVTSASAEEYFTVNANGVGSDGGASTLELGVKVGRTIDFNATGDASYITFGTNAKAATDIVFSGDANVSVSGVGVGATVANIDAGSMKGNLDFSAATLGFKSVSFTGGLGNDSVTLVKSHTGKISMGAGDDTVTLVTGSMGAGLKIDGGLGTDTLETGVLATSGDLDSMLDAFADGSIKGFEVLSIVGGATTSGIAKDTLDLNFNTLKGIEGIEGVVVAADGGIWTGGTTATAADDIIGTEGKAAVKVQNLGGNYITIASTLAGGVGGTGGTGNISNNGANGGQGGDGIDVSTLGTVDLRFNMEGDLTVTGGTGGAGGASKGSGSGADGSQGAGGDGIDASGASSLKITLIGDSTTANDLIISGGAGKTTGSSIKVADNATIILVDSLSAEGNAYSNITFSVATKTKGVTVDGSALHGKMDVTGTKFADTIKGGEAADTITGGAGANILTGGLGADTFNMTGAVAGTSDITKADINTITDWNFEGVADKLTVSYTDPGKLAILADETKVGSGFVKNGVVDFAIPTKVDTFVKAAAAATGTAGQVVAYFDGTNTYVFISDGAATFGDGDQIIKLAGHQTSQDIGLALAGDGITIA